MHNLSKTKKPSWLISLDGYRGNGFVATGCANMHVRGLDAQKKLAMQRAINSIAMQKNTKVKTTSNTIEKRNNGVLKSSKYSSASRYETNTDVSFKTKEEYYDEINKEYCILIQG